MSFYITKACGEKELFNIDKFKRSLQHSGAPHHVIMKIAEKIEKIPRLRTTKQIYSFAMKELERENPALAARYNLKQALIALGPTGYPFELYVAQIFKAQGYSVKLDEIARGFCVDHELDVVATKDSGRMLVECKFHNRQKYKSDVKVPLYIKARFDDIEKGLHTHREPSCKFDEAYIVTNTKFTSQAVDYSACANIKLIDWSRPKGGSLPRLIHKYSLFPLTTLTTLSMDEKKEVIKLGIILCSDLAQNEWTLKEVGLPIRERNKVLKEITDLCTFNSIMNSSN